MIALVTMADEACAGHQGVCPTPIELLRSENRALRAERDALAATVARAREVVEESEARLRKSTDRVLQFWNDRLRAALEGGAEE